MDRKDGVRKRKVWAVHDRIAMWRKICETIILASIAVVDEGCK